MVKSEAKAPGPTRLALIASRFVSVVFALTLLWWCTPESCAYDGYPPSVQNIPELNVALDAKRADARIDFALTPEDLSAVANEREIRYLLLFGHINSSDEHYRALLNAKKLSQLEVIWQDKRKARQDAGPTAKTLAALLIKFKDLKWVKISAPPWYWKQFDFSQLTKVNSQATLHFGEIPDELKGVAKEAFSLARKNGLIFKPVYSSDLPKSDRAKPIE